jgi:L,D-transpeptidase ErfK/SrfK
MHGTNKPPAVGMRASAGCVRLYPEDIALLFDAVPDGTKVTVVNQPVLLGWHGERLLVQTYEPLVDDKRDWSDVPKAIKRNLKKPKSPLWKKVAQHQETIDWAAVQAAAEKPRGIAFPVGPGTTGELAEAIARAPRVRNAIPTGATWNGVEDQYAGDPKFAKPAETASANAGTGQ